MKIYSLLLVKNEDDIIASTLRAAAIWSDKVIVLDNGSTDNTWKIVNELALEFSNIIPFAQDNSTFKIGMRAIMFNHFKSELTENDWWCIRLDADEFFIQDPREFLKEIKLKYKQVYKASYDYTITNEDIAEYSFSGNFENDKHKIQYYLPKTWSEIRFLRHSPKLHWDIDEFKPKPCGLTYPKQIDVAHYQYRSPQQMEKRFNVRKQAKIDGCVSFKHENGSSWQDYLIPRNGLNFDNKKDKLQTAGNRNNFNKRHTFIFKSILTFFNYY